MVTKAKVKQESEGMKYNPALDQYSKKVMFPEKVEQAKKNLKGRNLLKEIEEADKERITRP